MERGVELVLLLVCLQVAAAGLLLLPASVSAEGECGRAKCGMGTCSESSDYAFGFACQCRPGWSRNHLGDVQFPFLPCVIPNCSINYSCQGGPSSPPPPPPSQPPAAPPLTNLSIFDRNIPTSLVMFYHPIMIWLAEPSIFASPACLMQFCGDGGACEKASDFDHRCRCRDGFVNLLNDTSYPCYRQCSLGSDCKGLGIDVLNGSSPSSSPPAPVSFTVTKSGAGAPAASDGRLLELLVLVCFFWVQAMW